MIRDWQPQLVSNEQRSIELAQSGALDQEQIRRLADLRAVAAFRLRPVPGDPVEHVRFGYASIRPRLERLDEHDPTMAVSISSEDGYVYTFRPRTMLRRVLDHALDHLNQLDQWIIWQQSGQKPSPTDGWASSEDRLDEDSLPLSRLDLAAWLWRIDIAWRMLSERAAQLTPEQIDWTPPGEEWDLRRVLHHVSQGFYVAWLDNPLPEDAMDRYRESSRRLDAAITAVDSVMDTRSVIWLAAEAQTVSPDSIVAQLIETESSMMPLA